MWSLEVSTAPTLEPHTTAEAKAHIRVDTSDDDTYIDSTKLGARIALEEELGLSFLTQTKKLRLDGWPGSGRIHLPRGPVRSVTGIVYTDVDGNQQTLSTSIYSVFNARATPDVFAAADVCYIETAYGQSFPSLRAVPQNITITYLCGWLAGASIPQPVRHALLVMYGELYRNREASITGTIVARLDTVQRLTDNFRCRHYFGEDCG